MWSKQLKRKIPKWRKGGRLFSSTKQRNVFESGWKNKHQRKKEKIFSFQRPSIGNCLNQAEKANKNRSWKGEPKKIFFFPEIRQAKENVWIRLKKSNIFSSFGVGSVWKQREGNRNAVSSAKSLQQKKPYSPSVHEGKQSLREGKRTAPPQRHKKCGRSVEGQIYLWQIHVRSCVNSPK